MPRANHFAGGRLAGRQRDVEVLLLEVVLLEVVLLEVLGATGRTL